MRGKIALAVGLGLLAGATPALGQGKPDLFASEASCLAMGASRDHWVQWDYVCVPWSDGRWELVWINAKHKNK